MMDLVGKIMMYEDGEMDEEGMIDFFQTLLDNGMIYSLQGTYQRTAQSLIDAGLIERRSEL